LHISVPVIGLFSGAGGLDIGATWAGADVRLSVDNDPVACETLRLNSTNEAGQVLQADVATLSGRDLRRLAGLNRTDPCIVVGGPPCQPFSKASYWTDPGDDSRYRRARARGEAAPKPLPITEARPDGRRTLVQEFWRLVVDARADGFFFENVPSITHPRSRRILDDLLESAESAGYGVRLLRVNAAEYGVAQSRHRVVLLGLRGGVPKHAPPMHSATTDVSLARRLPAVTAGSVLRPFQGDRFAEPEEVVAGRWAKELRAIPPGWNYKYLTAWAGHKKPSFEAETRFWHFLLKLHPDRPSWTVPANPGPWVGPFHWDSRRLRTVELAALQSFPEKYIFAGTRRDRVRQIGNAVPPLMARSLMEPLVEALQKGRARRPSKRSGAGVP
jgi:DNA (cytosine-5)-methyltransferase 1